MRTGRPMAPLMLSDDGRETLERWTRRPKTAQGLDLRARLVLRYAESSPNTASVAALHVTPLTVSKWQMGCLAKRLDGLLDEPRPGAGRRIANADVEQVVTRTLESGLRTAAHWTTGSLARVCGLSQSTVSRIWRAFALRPHRTETFKLSPDPRQLRQAQDAPHSLVAGLTAPLLTTLHTHGRVVAQPGGALAGHRDHPAAPPGGAPQYARTGSCHPRLPPCSTVKTASRSCGPKRRMKSSRLWHDFVSGFRTQDGRLVCPNRSLGVTSAMEKGG